MAFARMFGTEGLALDAQRLLVERSRVREVPFCSIKSPRLLRLIATMSRDPAE
jgi:hypothetical protein